MSADPEFIEEACARIPEQVVLSACDALFNNLRSGESIRIKHARAFFAAELRARGLRYSEKTIQDWFYVLVQEMQMDRPDRGPLIRRGKGHLIEVV